MSGADSARRGVQLFERERREIDEERGQRLADDPSVVGVVYLLKHIELQRRGSTRSIDWAA